jgi:hypothetical protein
METENVKESDVDMIFQMMSIVCIDDIRIYLRDHLNDKNYHLLTEELLRHLAKIETFGNCESEEKFYKMYKDELNSYVYFTRFIEPFAILEPYTLEEIMQLTNTDDATFATKKITFESICDFLEDSFRNVHINKDLIISELVVLYGLYQKTNLDTKQLPKLIEKQVRKLHKKRYNL